MMPVGIDCLFMRKSTLLFTKQVHFYASKYSNRALAPVLYQAIEVPRIMRPLSHSRNSLALVHAKLKVSFK